MHETVTFGEPAWRYLLVTVLVSCTGFFFGLFIYYWRKLIGPAGKLLGNKSTTRLAILRSWPLWLGLATAWATYFTCYGSFYSVELEPGQALLLKYTWPKGEVRIENREIRSMEVRRAGIGWDADEVLIIEKKDGMKFRSAAPVSEGKTLITKLRTSLDSSYKGASQ
jgi:hypothetical protein